MNSQKIPYNYIENKIREFKAGVDYNFTGEEYNAPNENHKGYTTRSYKILSSQLEQEIKAYLEKQTAIFMQFEFEGWTHAMEWNRPKGGKDWEEKYYSSVLDENGNGLAYDIRDNNWNLHLTYLDKPTNWRRENFNQRYLAAKKAWEEKGSPLQNTPPSGTKCWNCYEVISDADIAAGRYRLENTRLGGENGRLDFFKTFEHVKGVCKSLAYDCALRNNYRYHTELIKIWKTYPQKNHEYNCQDCLNRMWNEINGNLIYLETWAKEQVQKIAHTKQTLAEIKARLDQLTASGQFHNCGIKKCCEQHDRPDHTETEKVDLIADSSPEKDFPKSKKPTLDKQTILDWMKEKGITKISLDPATNQLVFEYQNQSSQLVSEADLPTEWKNQLKKETLQSPLYSNQPISQNKDKWPTGIIVGSLGVIVVGLILAVGILVYRNRKKV